MEMESWNNLLKNAYESWGQGGEKHAKELERARTLVREKKYEEALKAYVKVFEEGRDTSPMVGVRLSYVLIETAELGKVYEPAHTTLIGYRDAHEQLMRSGEFSIFSIQEWAALCDHTEPNRKIEFYDLLMTETSKNQELISNVRRMIWLELISSHRYEEFSAAELSTRLKEAALMAGQQLSPNSLINSTLPHMANDPEVKEFAIKRLLQDCSAIYECAIGLKKQSLAKKAFKLATYYQKTGSAYACFIIAATRAGDTTRSKKLVEDSKWCLPESEMRPVNAVKEKFNL
jgi:hypothetical protein